MFPALLPSLSASTRDLLLAMQPTAEGRRGLTVRLASEQWAVGAPAREQIRALGERTDEMAARRDAMFNASNVAVVERGDELAELVFFDASRRAARERHSLIDAVETYIVDLRVLAADMDTFAISVTPVGTVPRVADRLVDLIDLHTSMEYRPSEV